MREFLVESRKCFFRIEFYVALFILSGIIGFFVYQLASEGTIVTVVGETEKLAFDELLTGIMQMLHYLGVIGIILAILCWQTLGKEMDQKSFTTYIIHSRDKWKLLFAKISVLFLAYCLILAVSIGVSIGIYLVTGTLETSLSWSTVDRFTKILFLMLCYGGVFILLATLLSLRFGAMGVLVATIGTSILSAVFKGNRIIKDFLPINLIDLESTPFLQSILIFSAYIVVMLVAIRLIAKYREIGV